MNVHATTKQDFIKYDNAKSSLENFTMFVYCLKKQITFTTATAEQQDHKL